MDRKEIDERKELEERRVLVSGPASTRLRGSTQQPDEETCEVAVASSGLGTIHIKRPLPSTCRMYLERRGPGDLLDGGARLRPAPWRFSNSGAVHAFVNWETADWTGSCCEL